MASFGNKDKIWIKKEEHKVTFDIKIPMPKGAVFAMYLKHLNLEETVNMAAEIKKITIQQAHEQLGHIGKDAKTLNRTLTPGLMSPCEACAVGKARQHNLPKDPEKPMADGKF